MKTIAKTMEMRSRIKRKQDIDQKNVTKCPLHGEPQPSIPFIDL